MNPLLRVHNLTQQLGKKKILQGINFEAHAGNITVILGPNGAGKTTLLKTIIGFYPSPSIQSSDNGNSIIFDGITINEWSIYKKVEAGLGYLPQQTSLFQQMTVKDNLALVYEHHTYWHKKPLETFVQERDFLLEQTKLTHSIPQKASDLSGGQQRKLEIVRALLMHPKLIMFDEPFAGVDPKSIYELKAIFLAMAKQGIGIIISDHHVDQLLSCADFVYVILQGNVVTSGTVQDILLDKHTKDHYLGNQFYNEITERFLP